MRVLIVLREFYSLSRPIGGAERQALKLAQRLIDKNITVRVVTGHWDWDQPSRGKVENVPVHRLFTGWRMSDMRGFKRISQYLYLLSLYLYLFFHRNEYDFIHCHSAVFGAAIAVKAGKQLHKKTLVRSMASGRWGDIKRLREGESGSIYGTQWMLSQLLNADCVVALNKAVVTELTEIGVEPERIVCLPNGVETEKIKPKRNYESRNEIALTFVGRLHPQKGVDVLLSALEHVRSQQPQLCWRLKLIGDGKLRSQLETQANQLSVNKNVEFLGQVDDPFPLLYESDIFVLPSRSEGMSNALLEAMAHGLPCIVTNIDGNKDIIIHNENGLLVQLDDDDDLAAAIIALATNRQLREQLGRAALKAVQENYSLESVTNRYIDLYTNLLQREKKKSISN